ncbi:MAG TPA: tetratricopeptide repeat protein [Tepidisphaeraceae bacterium]|nr:tetratricopeptide repeat protein [Tepidisphaeraceae bacterium]
MRVNHRHLGSLAGPFVLRSILPVVAALLLLCSGCTPTGRNPAINRAIADYYSGNYELAVQGLEPYAAKTDENYVLNNARLGSAAIADYDLDRAESSFYKAYEVINSVKVNDPGRAAAAIAIAEQLKIWKGEPFERAMVNFYLGLVYYMRHDYANARAAFENALFKLRDYGTGDVKEDKYQEVESNFLIAYFMLGKCWLKLDREDKAKDMFDRVAKLRPDLSRLLADDRPANSNVLLIVEFGEGPRKVNQGDASIAVFRPKPEEVPPLPLVKVNVDGRNLNLSGLNIPPVDLLATAQDRRWQTFDTIRLTKAAIGYGMMGVGAYEAVKEKPNYGAAAALIGAGALLKASSQADLRCWEMLPRTVYVLPLILQPGKHDITVKVGAFSQNWRDIVAPETGDNTYYMRITPVNIGPRQWPPQKLTADVISHTP